MKRHHRGRTAPLWGKDTLAIERMSQEGRGVATRRGKIVFVSGALPGEQVRVQCTAVKRDYDEADLLELIAGSSPSAERVVPPCPLYGTCGGCSLQHWSPAAQLQHKQVSLEHALRKLSPPALDPPVASPDSAFRHRLRLQVVRTPDRDFVLGLRRYRSHDSVAVPHCLVANAAANALLAQLPARLRAVPELQGLREIEIDADSDHRLGLCFRFAAHPGDRLLGALRDAMLSGTVVALRVQLVASRSTRRDAPDMEDTAGELCSGQDILVAGELRLHSEACATESRGAPPVTLSYLPGDFTQTNWEVNTALVARALDWLRPARDETALDLFCGVGNFTLPLARCTHTVHALEGDAGMTARVAANARSNGLQNIRARTINLLAPEVVLPTTDIAILDPPRAGAKAVCEALARSTVKRVLYVSCHPSTLARDAGILHQARFRLVRAAAVDMFVHTGHSEAIALFERR